MTLDNSTGVIEVQTWSSRVQRGRIAMAEQDHTAESPALFAEELRLHGRRIESTHRPAVKAERSGRCYQKPGLKVRVR